MHGGGVHDLETAPASRAPRVDGGPWAVALNKTAATDGPMAWVSWTYERPVDVRTEYGGRIDHIELAYRAGGVVQETVPGPWVFTFSVPNGSAPSGRSHRDNTVGEA